MADPSSTANEQTATQSSTNTAQHETDVYEPASQGMKKYNLYYTTSRLNATLHLGKSTVPATYYLRTHLSLRKPQLEVLRGGSKESPMVAFGKIRKTSRHMLIGLGDCRKGPENQQLSLEELIREKNALRRSNYSFGTAAGSEGGGRIQYTWRKNMNKWVATVYDCVDESGRVVAKMFSGGAFNFKKGGEVEVLEGLHQDLEDMLMISSLSIWAWEALDYQSLLRGYERGSKDNQAPTRSDTEPGIEISRPIYELS